MNNNAICSVLHVYKLSWLMSNPLENKFYCKKNQLCMNMYEQWYLLGIIGFFQFQLWELNVPSRPHILVNIFIPVFCVHGNVLEFKKLISFPWLIMFHIKRILHLLLMYFFLFVSFMTGKSSTWKGVRFCYSKKNNCATGGWMITVSRKCTTTLVNISRCIPLISKF